MVQQGRLRMALIGSGYIADVHAAVLRRNPGAVLTAVCDPLRDRAERLARRHGGAAVFAAADELLGSGVADAAHVLVPPGLHRTVAERCLQAGLHVLVEKPLALSMADVDALDRAAAAHGRVLAVNHNLLFHPAVQRLCAHVREGRLGRLEHLVVVHNVPLRQLQTGDTGHFMFATEGNILFEQGVHLIAVVQELLGPCRHVEAVLGERRSLPHGVAFADEWHLMLRCERGGASLLLRFGRPLGETTLQAIGSDGAAFADLQRSACWLRRKTRRPDFLDHARNLTAGGLHLLGQGCATVAGYGLSLFGLVPPSDPFLRSMRGSIDDFVAAVRQGRKPRNGVGAARAVVRTCIEAARAARTSLQPPARPGVPAPGPARPGEVVVLGGTGTLGRPSVRLLRASGRPVTLLVRRPELLPAELCDGSVRIFAGDAADPAALARAFAGADAVLHLATVAGDDPEQVATAMAQAVGEAAAAAARACVRRLVYASSTAALWLGGRSPVAGDAEPDPRPAARAPYSRAKIAAERELRKHSGQELEVVVVRPAVVVGGGAPAQHSGIGLWVRDNHCIGWGSGRHPLPLLLADDCAAALVAALDAKAAAGRSYNLAGAVRLTARDYVAALRMATGRDIWFHPAPIPWLWLQEVGKHVVKFLARRPRQWPSWRDLRSRSFRAPLDCSDAERDLAFRPESDRARFLERAFGAP